MERVCFLKRIEISRIIFNVIRREFNIENVLIENNPHIAKSKSILLMQNRRFQIYVVSSIRDNALHFTMDIYRYSKRIKRINMFGLYGNVGYDYTRKNKEEFEKDCVIEFWKAYDKIPKYIIRNRRD